MKVPVPDQLLPGPVGRVHFVGIGGAGLSGIARSCSLRRHRQRQRRWGVLGLEALGARSRCHVGPRRRARARRHTSSSHRESEDNPEVVEAQRQSRLPRSAASSP
jgi:UDP-N-acetylmuramate--alanine ligase